MNPLQESKQELKSLKAKSFNKNQLKAVTYGEGPLLIAAGPGSGKTTVLTERIRFIVEQLHVRPENILVMTFSRAAAAEMRDRFFKMEVTDADKVCFGTFHSVFYRVLKLAYGELARNYIFDDESMEQIRFDEMLQLTEELLSQRNDICEKIRKKYQWILIDEFQDIDDLQFEIVKLIAPPENNPNLTVVGDDDQSIYAFRGANPGIMLDFEKIYPGTETVFLDINYRSGSEITETAMKLITHNKARFDKHIESGRGAGAEVNLLEFEDAMAEYRFIANKLSEAVLSGLQQNELAVLHRNNIQPWQLDKLLKEKGLEEVKVMTFHKSKGLEFKKVWLIDICKGIIPSSRDEKGLNHEEERRLFYVAMTRAKDELNICWCLSSKNRKMMPSEFVFEL